MGRDDLITYNSPEEYVAAMQEALLDAANRPLAIRLAGEAIKRYPEDEEVQKFDYVLNPPPARVVPSTPESRQSVRADREWIEKHRDRYRNRWIALRCGELLADADSLKELIDRVGEKNFNGVLFTVIY